MCARSPSARRASLVDCTPPGPMPSGVLVLVLALLVLVLVRVRCCERGPTETASLPDGFPTRRARTGGRWEGCLCVCVCAHTRRWLPLQPN